jgi:hypothetical protein
MAQSANALQSAMSAQYLADVLALPSRSGAFREVLGGRYPLLICDGARILR